MNILDLKRKAHGFTFRSDEGHDPGEGRNHADPGTAVGRSANNNVGSGFGHDPGEGRNYADPGTATTRSENDDTHEEARSYAQRNPTWAQALERAAAFLGLSFGGLVGAVGFAAAARAVMNAPGVSSSDKATISRGMSEISRSGGGGASVDRATGNSGSGQANSVAELAAGAANLDPTSMIERMTNDGYNEWNDRYRPAMEGAITTLNNRSNEFFNAGRQVAGEQLGLARSMRDDYNTIYRPAGQRFASEVYGMNDPATIAAARSTAMKDASDSAYAEQGMANRRLLGMVSPTSGRYNAFSKANAMGVAGAKLSAALNSDRSLKTTYLSGLDRLNTMGNTNLTNTNAVLDSAGKWGNNAFEWGKAPLTAADNFARTSSGMRTGLGNMASQAGSLRNGAANVALGRDQFNDSSNMGKAIETALGTQLARRGADYLFGTTKNDAISSFLG